MVKLNKKTSDIRFKAPSLQTDVQTHSVASSILSLVVENVGKDIHMYPQLKHCLKRTFTSLDSTVTYYALTCLYCFKNLFLDF